MYSVIIAAAGKGVRMNADMPKQYMKLNAVPIICRSVSIFDSIESISEIILVIPAADENFVKNEIIPICGAKTKIKIVFGGRERQDSVYNGLLEVENKNSIVLIHDAARPLVTEDMILNCIKKAEEKGAAILAVPVADTLKITENGNIIETVKRDNMWLAQTPQAFFYPLILKAHIKAKEENIYKTDDAALVEYLKEKVYIVKGSRFNIKITENEDLKFAEEVLQVRSNMSTEQHKKEAPLYVSIGIISVSSTRSIADDESGKWIKKSAEEKGNNVVYHGVVKDDIGSIREKIEEVIEREKPDALILTGGTGAAAKDVTIEAVKPFFEKELDAFKTIFAMLSFKEIVSAAILSRASAGIFKNSVIFCIPGSIKACRLACESIIFPELSHIVKHLRDN